MNFTNSETTVAEIDGGEGAAGTVAKALKKRRGVCIETCSSGKELLAV